MKRYYLTALTFICICATGFAETENVFLESSSELLSKGLRQFKSGHRDDALATFSKVLEHDTDNLDARFGQAIIFAEQNRHQDAFAAYDWIIQKNPHHADAWNGRGLAAFNMEDFDEALASFHRSVTDHPANGFFYESIAWTQMCRGEFTEAAEWAKKALLAYHYKNEASLYPLLIAYFSYYESGDGENALRTLQYASRNKTSNQWPAPVIDYLNGKINEAELISFVSNLAEETEARTYIGLQKRSKGRAKEANRHLDWVRRNGDSQVFEYTLAKALASKEDVVIYTPSIQLNNQSTRLD